MVAAYLGFSAKDKAAGPPTCCRCWAGFPLTQVYSHPPERLHPTPSYSGCGQPRAHCCSVCWLLDLGSLPRALGCHSDSTSEAHAHPGQQKRFIFLAPTPWQ